MAELTSFLEEVRKGIRSEMSPRQVDAVLQETEAHLRERIDALVELGISAEAAEQESITAFGSPISFVNETIDAHRPTRKSMDAIIVRVAIYASAIALVTPFIAIAIMNSYIFLLPFPLLLAVAAVSFRGRRAIPGKLSVVAVGLFLAFWVACGMFSYSLNEYGGSGFVPKWEAMEWQRSMEMNMPAQEMGGQLNNRRYLLLNAKNPFALAQTWGLTQGDKILSPIGSKLMPPRITYRPFAESEALDIWKKKGAYVARELSDIGEQSREGYGAISAAQNASFPRNLKAAFAEARPMLGIWLALLLGANLLGAAIGWLTRRLRGISIVIQVQEV